MPMATAPVDVKQQMLVQWCMSSQVFSEASFVQAVRRINHDDEDEVVDVEEGEGIEELRRVVEHINESMNAFSLELRSCMDQTSGMRMWALANTKADAIATGATPFSASELSVLKALVEGIFTEPMGNYTLSLHDALRLASSRRAGSTGASLSRVDAESLIRRFMADGWLATDDSDGYVVLGMRSVIELQSFFSVGFADYIRLCSLCKEMATCGIVCMECLEPVHPYCANRVAAASASGHQLSCPACHKHIMQPRRFGPGERGVPHELGGKEEESVGDKDDEPTMQSIKKLRIQDSSDEED
ncbi:hypothetical protein GGI20_005037 [Coemansia sp. BCRC 34301]|nr:hypothetical protein GGI20_005037 [Coemansia sp. BCRC 34301]